MRTLFFPVIVVIIAFNVGACHSSSKQGVFGDSVCLKDTLKFNSNIKLKPYVYISVRNCKADTILWSYNGMGVNKKMGFADLMGTDISLDKKFIRCVIQDTAYAWLFFNDGITGRGYQLKLPFSKGRDIGRKSSGINNLDPKFSVDNSLAAYTDRGNIYVEEIATGKTAMMTFGKGTDMDYDVIHETLDSVNVTPSRIWVKVKIDKEWKELEKNIKLE